MTSTHSPIAKKFAGISLALTLILAQSVSASEQNQLGRPLSSSQGARATRLETSRMRNYAWYLLLLAKKVFCSATEMCRPNPCLDRLDASVRLRLPQFIAEKRKSRSSQERLARTLIDQVLAWDSATSNQIWSPIPDHSQLEKDMIFNAAALYFLFPNGEYDRWIVAVEQRLACQL
jgi:hypothetical protein